MILVKLAKEVLMTQVNMLKAKTELSKLVHMLETRQEEVIYISKNGRPVAQLTLIAKAPKQSRIGAAKGGFTVPEDFDLWDDEVAGSFGDMI